MIGDVATESDPQLLTIGEFAYQARLTARALRIYDEIGLLQPAEVDPWNGYRRYGADQVGQGRLIGMLRAVDMSLAEIGQLLADLRRRLPAWRGGLRVIPGPLRCANSADSRMG